MVRSRLLHESQSIPVARACCRPGAEEEGSIAAGVTDNYRQTNVEWALRDRSTDDVNVASVPLSVSEQRRQHVRVCFHADDASEAKIQTILSGRARIATFDMDAAARAIGRRANQLALYVGYYCAVQMS